MLSQLVLGTLIFSLALFHSVLVPTNMLIGYQGFPLRTSPLFRRTHYQLTIGRNS